MVNKLIARLIGLHVKLMACQARLEAETDSEALHDLRTTVRRLRSLLRPLRGMPGVDRLEEAARQVGQVTTPLRDLEVLAAHLQAQGFAAAAATRRQQLRGSFPNVAKSSEVLSLLQLLDAFPSFLRAAQRQGILRGAKARVAKRLAKQWRTLNAALRDPAHDRHRLRLLIKRTRYAAEAYPELEPLAPALVKRLKSAQAALGDWHDHWQWLAQAAQQSDLAACVPGWRSRLAMAEQRADRVLEKLRLAVN